MTNHLKSLSPNSQQKNNISQQSSPVLLFPGAARVPLVTWQGCVGPHHPDGARREDGLVGEGDLVVGGELVRLDPHTDGELVQVTEGSLQKRKNIK